ncbi:MAG: hypothetical protein U0271_23690 [Polyangiaceae bacterium]
MKHERGWFGRGLSWCALGSVAALLSCSQKEHRSHQSDDDDDRPIRAASNDKAASSAKQRGTAAPTMAPSANAVDFDVYVMSQCPYAVDLERMLGQVLTNFGSDLNFRVDYIGKKKGAELTSMHGPEEVIGDLQQVCAAKLSPKFFDFILCQNNDVKQIGSTAASCAETVGIPKAALDACATGPDGQTLLAASFDRSAARGATGSPTIFIAGTKYAGRRSAAAISRAICDAAKTSLTACANIPAAPAVNITVLEDGRCGGCDKSRVDSLLKRFDNPVVTHLDVGSPSGRALFESLKPVELPAAVFDSTLDADPDGLKQVKTKVVGNYRFQALGSWNPECADDGGCSKAECASALVCRKELPHRIDAFVMSKCPFAEKGMTALKALVDDARAKREPLDIQLSFIGKATGDKLTSMHGDAEVVEDLRQVCAQKHYAANLKFLDYVFCRYKDIKSDDWRSCTGGSTGIDAEVIRRCAEGTEGPALLKSSFADSVAAGVVGSPTWLVNNRYKFNGVTLDVLRQNLCDHNKAMRVCAAP